jgi:antitoxin (DNA-binding transcriptional repressor) of toxin-antitoxin stability system
VALANSAACRPTPSTPPRPTSPSSALAEAGEEVILLRGKNPAVKITLVAAVPKPQRKVGALKGKIKIGPEFFDPLPEEELKHWK